MSRTTACLGTLLFLGLLALAPGPSRADWLVLRDGSRVETRGAWNVRGQLVVFTGKDGSLASLRVAQVDLAASRAATAAAARVVKPEAPAPQVGPVRPPVAVFTDQDFRHRRSATTAGEKPAEEPAATAKTRNPTVTDWRRVDAPDDHHVIISGTLTNTTASAATAITVQVELYDEGGQKIAARSADLARGALLPAASTAFEAPFPDVFAYAAVRFRVGSTQVMAKPPAGSEPEAPTGEGTPAPSSSPP